MQDGQDIHDNDQFVRQPEGVEDETARELCRKHVDDTDNDDEQDAGESWNYKPLKYDRTLAHF